LSFDAGRWAEAYLASCEKLGENSSDGLSFLEQACPLLARISGGVPATHAASRFAALAKRAAERTQVEGVTTAVALLFLLLKHGHADKQAVFMEALRRLVDKRNGVMRVTLELADAPSDAPDDVSSEDGSFAEAFRASLIRENGAKDARVETKLNPALLGGFRWTADSIRADYSLKGKLERMGRG
jgi:F0F1-type ATP synthase delta subunit